MEELISSLLRLKDEILKLAEVGEIASAKAKFKEFLLYQSHLKTLPAEDKPVFGKTFNEIKKSIEPLLIIEKKEIESFFDFLPGKKTNYGSFHPISQTILEVSDIFARLGFEEVAGPQVEDVWHNFIALNIPEDHPARDVRDNFYLNENVLLRSQTSTVQIRVMSERMPPIRIISLGRVYRPDPADATHSPMFHQLEGLYIDKDVSMSHLKTVLNMFIQLYFGDDIETRFRPSFFPFTEPSIEIDMKFGDKWIELGGAGMVDPNVFDEVGYNSEEYSGFAFGLGIERLAMRRYEIKDMRELFENDIRFLNQFGAS